MQDAIEYLANRIREDEDRLEHNPDHKISNGVRLFLEIRNDYTDLYDLCERSLDIIKGYVSKKPNHGTALLTATSGIIGRMILQQHDQEILPTKDAEFSIRLDITRIHISLGDLFIEALFNTDYIEISHEFPYNISLTTAYELEPVTGVIHTESEPIRPVTKMLQDNKRPIIKRKRNWDPLPGTDIPFIRAADKVQQQGWKINKQVLEVLRNNPMYPYYPEEDTEDELLRAEQSKSKVREYNSIIHKAEQLDDIFYQYVEFDYRGRMYFNEAFLNYQGSDYARGLMLFDKPRRVTDKGLVWFARHTATSYNQSYSIADIPAWCTTDYASYLADEGLDSISVDKMTLRDRELWTHWNMKKIVENYDLLDCEKPVSFLACCFEWRKYHDNPEYFYSALPIPIDGSNNGWQHLAAISKDPEAARLVGLVPTEIQEDFYVKTAKALIDIMPEWFEERDMPMKHIRKGISKRGSMTRAYSAGAGKIGENMWLDCRQAGYHDKYGITEKDCMLLAKNLVLAISGVCLGPLRTMKYLQDVAMTELNAQGKDTLRWRTPAKFMVEFQATAFKKARVRNTIRGFRRINHVVIIPIDRPDRRKFMTGISPNFIHSLDAAHMCLVIDRWNGSFGGVHDSFSTHADDVDDLLQLTKEVFIEMYAHDDNYKGIADRILRTNPGITLDSGPLDIKEVMNSDYFFS